MIDYLGTMRDEQMSNALMLPKELRLPGCDGKNDGVFVVPALGGDERQLTTAECLYTVPSPIAWTLDGKDLLMMGQCRAKGAV